MSAKKLPVKTTFENAAGRMPVLRPSGASADLETAEADADETVKAVLQRDTQRAVILRLVETVKGL
jgi:hypothetical protein